MYENVDMIYWKIPKSSKKFYCQILGKTGMKKINIDFFKKYWYVNASPRGRGGCGSGQTLVITADYGCLCFKGEQNKKERRFQDEKT